MTRSLAANDSLKSHKWQSNAKNAEWERDLCDAVFKELGRHFMKFRVFSLSLQVAIDNMI